MRRVSFGLAIVLLAWHASPVPAQDHCTNCYNARIVTEDGSPLPGEPRIIPDITGKIAVQCLIRETFGNGTILYQTNPRLDLDSKDADACSITISLTGYHKLTATLHPNATVVLKRVGDHEGSAISMVSLQAPRHAKKAYDKGAIAFSATAERKAAPRATRA